MTNSSSRAKQTVPGLCGGREDLCTTGRLEKPTAGLRENRAAWMPRNTFGKSFYFYNFIVAYFIYHAIQLLQLSNSIIFTKLYNPHHASMLDHLHSDRVPEDGLFNWHESLGSRLSSKGSPPAHLIRVVCEAAWAPSCGWIRCCAKEPGKEGAGWRGIDWQAGSLRWPQGESTFLFHLPSSSPYEILVIINLLKVGDTFTLTVYHSVL